MSLKNWVAIGCVLVGPIANRASAEEWEGIRTATYGDLIVKSSQSWRGTEVPALITHHEVYQNKGKKLVGRYEASSQGDEGKAWVTQYTFALNSKKRLRIREEVYSFRPLWGLDKSGEYGFYNGRYSETDWNGSGFELVVSSNLIGISRGTEFVTSEVRISGKLFSKQDVVFGDVIDEPASIIWQDSGQPYVVNVRLADGREGHVQLSSIKLASKIEKRGHPDPGPEK